MDALVLLLNFRILQESFLLFELKGLKLIFEILKGLLFLSLFLFLLFSLALNVGKELLSLFQISLSLISLKLHFVSIFSGCDQLLMESSFEDMVFGKLKLLG